jgi:hypothetical protein
MDALNLHPLKSKIMMMLWIVVFIDCLYCLSRTVFIRRISASDIREGYFGRLTEKSLMWQGESRFKGVYPVGAGPPV